MPPAGERDAVATIGAAVKRCLAELNRPDGHHRAVIEIRDSARYKLDDEEPLVLKLPAGRELVIRAGQYCRPALRLGVGRDRFISVEGIELERPDARDAQAQQPKHAKVAADDKPENKNDAKVPPPSGRVTFDGLLVWGAGVRVSGGVREVVVRDCTLVPGWTLSADCGAQHAAEPSIVIQDTTARLRVERSIIGTIEALQNEVQTEPLAVHISDSILDATRPELELEAIGVGWQQIAADSRRGQADDNEDDTDVDRGNLGGAGGAARRGARAARRPKAHVSLTVERSTVFGLVLVHDVALAENAIFNGEVHVRRRGLGCMRYCYVPPGSQTPPQHQCQPDTAERDALERVRREAAESAEPLEPGELDAIREAAHARVRPRFNFTRYGERTYAQLADDCPAEIARGADDESEMGVFHDLFQPQRLAALRGARLDEFTPTGASAGVFIRS